MAASQRRNYTYLYCLQSLLLYQYCAHISKMYFSLWKPPGVSERMWSVYFEGSISGQNHTLGGYSGQPSEQLESLMTGK
jgi:hypothetical protein